MIFIKAFFTNLIFSGKYDHIGGKTVREARESTTYALFNGLMLTGIIGVTAFFFINLAAQNVASVMLYVDVILFSVLLVILLLARTRISLWIPSTMASGFYTLFSWYMLWSGSSGGSSPVWLLLVPTVIIYLMKPNVSRVFFLVSFLLALYVFFFTTTYETSLGARYFGVFVILYAFGQVVSSWLDSLTERAVESSILLEEETDELNAMRNNIDLGIFLLDKSFTLQPLYSKHLSEIFESENLQDRDFVSLFEKSLVGEQLEILGDYLEMLFTSDNVELLEDINPLKHTQWQSPTGVKHLSISVSKIEKSGQPLLLGTVRDISKEIELEKQLADEHEKRQSEIKVISEVMRATPEALAEFIADTEYEFGEANSVLRATGVAPVDALHKVYQSVHAMKSNALIVGMQTFADKLHEAENEINACIANGGNYSDLLTLIFTLERAMEELDIIKSVLKKISLFSTNSSATDSRDVLIKSISTTIAKVLNSTEEGSSKLIDLDVQQIEWEGITSEKRRDIKDLILQLVRNSCMHGIESTKNRVKKNKNETGSIRLSISKKENSLIVQYSDDGAGIDYEKVLQKGKELHLIPDSTTIDDKNTLIKLLASSTFSTANSVTQYAGRGVGMSLIFDKVKKYGGKVKIKSSQDVGTTFLLSL